jgi:hypothetical protein
MCSGERDPGTKIEHLWSAYMLRRFSDRRQVCVCADPEEKSCQYETGWTFRAPLICVRCGWSMPRRKGKPKGRRWVQAATAALRTERWFMELTAEFDQLNANQS